MQSTKTPVEASEIDALLILKNSIARTDAFQPLPRWPYPVATFCLIVFVSCLNFDTLKLGTAASLVLGASFSGFAGSLLYLTECQSKKVTALTKIVLSPKDS
jgi:hypothetical protein